MLIKVPVQDGQSHQCEMPSLRLQLWLPRSHTVRLRVLEGTQGRTFISPWPLPRSRESPGNTLRAGLRVPPRRPSRKSFCAAGSRRNFPPLLQEGREHLDQQGTGGNTSAICGKEVMDERDAGQPTGPRGLGKWQSSRSSRTGPKTDGLRAGSWRGCHAEDVSYAPLYKHIHTYILLYFVYFLFIFVYSCTFTFLLLLIVSPPSSESLPGREGVINVNQCC